MKTGLCSIPASADKLRELAGPGKLAVREWRIRQRLNWHTKPKTAVRHMLQGEQFPRPEEANEIEAAYEANRRENAALFDTLRRAIAAMEAVDPAFHGPQIEALRQLLDHDWNLGADKSEKA